MTNYYEIQMDKELRSAYFRTEDEKKNVFDRESRSHSSFTVQRGHRGDSQKSQKQNENQLLHGGEPVRILGIMSTEKLVKEHQELGTTRRAALHAVRDGLHQGRR